MIARAWYVRCDGPCGGNPAEVSCLSAPDARRISHRATSPLPQMSGDGFVTVTVNRKRVDLCPACQQPEVANV